MTSSPAELALATLPEPARRHVADLRDHLRAAAGDNLASLIVYGSAVRGGYDPADSDVDVIVVLRDTALPRLLACSNALALARHAGRVEAMVLRADEIAAAADVFPLFYDDVRGRHVVAAGDDPFAQLVISDAHRLLRVKQELREARIRMRRAAIDTQGDDGALVGALGRKVKQIRGPLHALLRLRGQTCDDTLAAVLSAAGAAYDLDCAPLLRVRADPAAAHAVYRRLLEAAIDDVEERASGARP